MTVRTRIAPSPTGYPHIGTIYQAWLDYVFAQKNKGEFIVRIEDTDQKRLVTDAELKIWEALDWFGIVENESPRKGGNFAPYRQSERLEIYKKYALQLIESGNAYYCFCSSERLDTVRKQMQKEGKPPMYDKHCRSLSADEIKAKLAKGESYVIRLKVPDNEKIIVRDLIRGEIEFDSNNVDDQVLLKSDGFATYHLAAIVDDHEMQISHAVRGEEWLPSAPKHFLVYRFLGWEPPIYVHTPTLRNPDKTKLSKRKGHTNVDWFINEGFLPDALLNFLSQLGWTHPEEKEIFSREEFKQLFELANLSPIGPVFDEAKLRWMNGKYVRELSEDEFITWAKKFADQDLSNDIWQKLAYLIKERVEVFSQIPELIAFLNLDIEIDLDLIKKQSKQESESIKKLLSELKNNLNNLPIWSVLSIESVIRDLKAAYPDWKPRDFFMTIRVVTTAFPVTPPLFESIELLGKELVVKRIESVISRL